MFLWAQKLSDSRELLDLPVGRADHANLDEAAVFDNRENIFVSEVDHGYT